MAAVVVVGGCPSEEPVAQNAVASPFGRASDLTLLTLPEGQMALAWRESEAPNDADGRAAFLRLSSRTVPVQRDENPSTASSELVAADGTILRVLAQRGQDDPDTWGLVVVVRDIDTSELLPDIGYRTLPVFAGATLTDLHLVPAAGGALLAWIERSGADRPADLVQLVALDALGSPIGPPLVLTQLPTEVVRIDLIELPGEQEAALVALVRSDDAASVRFFRLRVDDGVGLEDEGTLDGADVSLEDRVVDVERGGDCLEVLVTERGRPVRARVDPDAPELAAFEPLHADADAPGLDPRLFSAGDSVLYLYDRPDGATRRRAIVHGDDCRESRVGLDREFPLSRRRCALLAVEPGDPLPFACATSCLTLECGAQWIYFGRAEY